MKVDFVVLNNGTYLWTVNTLEGIGQQAERSKNLTHSHLLSVPQGVQNPKSKVSSPAMSCDAVARQKLLTNQDLDTEAFRAGAGLRYSEISSTICRGPTHVGDA